MNIYFIKYIFVCYFDLFVYLYGYNYVNEVYNFLYILLTSALVHAQYWKNNGSYLGYL